ncbi:hypothetical protein J6590_102837 [Homalodisca vitripennis]|nr:hypothetical protein J6590_102837 [Homalodisca vitripennis]
MSGELKSKIKGRIIPDTVSYVYKFMKEEAYHQTVNIPLSKARQRTAAATGVSERVVTQINARYEGVAFKKRMPFSDDMFLPELYKLMQHINQDMPDMPWTKLFSWRIMTSYDFRPTTQT